MTITPCCHQRSHFSTESIVRYSTRAAFAWKSAFVHPSLIVNVYIHDMKTSYTVVSSDAFLREGMK
jgi:hypothetical protein